MSMASLEIQRNKVIKWALLKKVEENKFFFFGWFGWFWFFGVHSSFPGIDGFCQVVLCHTASTHWAVCSHSSLLEETLCFVLCCLCFLVFKIRVTKPVIVSLQTRTIPSSFLYPSCYDCQRQYLEISPVMINRGSETLFVPSFLGHHI